MRRGVVPDAYKGIEEAELLYGTKEEQMALLQQVLQANDADGEEENVALLDGPPEMRDPGERSFGRKPGSSKRSGHMSSLSGADDNLYNLWNSSKNTSPRRPPTLASTRSSRCSASDAVLWGGGVFFMFIYFFPKNKWLFWD